MPRKKRPKHPMQPIVVADDKVVRFLENRIVRWMLNELGHHGRDFNYIAAAFDRDEYNDDYQQLMQLIGYSVSGYGDLSRRDRAVAEAADRIAFRKTAKRGVDNVNRKR